MVVVYKKCNMNNRRDEKIYKKNDKLHIEIRKL